MSDINTGDIIRVGAGLNFQGIYDVVNVFHFEWTVGGDIVFSTALTRIQSYLNDLYDEIKTQLSDTIGTGSLAISNVTQGLTFGASPWSPTWAGVESGQCTAPGVCCFAWGRTQKPRVQIRKYFGVFGEVNMVDGVWTSTVQNACEALMAIHIAQTAIGGASEVTGVAYNRLLDTITKANSVASSAEPAYQRRRKRGRGS